MVDKNSGCVTAVPLPGKGMNEPWLPAHVVRTIQYYGHHAGVILKSDRGHAIADLLHQAARLRAARTHIEKSALGDSPVEWPGRTSSSDCSNDDSHPVAGCRGTDGNISASGYSCGLMTDPAWSRPLQQEAVGTRPPNSVSTVARTNICGRALPLGNHGYVPTLWSGTRWCHGHAVEIRCVDWQDLVVRRTPDCH